MLNKFEQEQKKIIEAYYKLIDNEFVPLKKKNITEKDIEESIKELQEERFIVSFCGQIKAGKSTLLNALLFGDEILPAASTPHTAKITIINYAEEPYFEVVYYSEEEWKNLKETLLKEEIKEKEQKTNYFEKYLKPQINHSINQGVYEDEVIGKPKETIKDLSKLNDFVGAKGKYTPFVKEIHLYYPNEILKKITVVDTPGTNDPNPYRSKITEDWIHKSNAIVYVVYAGQAFSKPEIEFIDKYLLGIDPQLFVFAVNKMDLVNKEELRAWVNKVKEDERLRARRIMQDEDSVVYVSGLGGLIRKLFEAGKLENSKYAEDEEFLERLDESGWIEEPGLKDLERVIEEKIIKSKGEKILSSHRAKIRGILVDKIIELKEELNFLSENVKFHSMKKEELKKKKEEYELKFSNAEIKRTKLIDERAVIMLSFQKKLYEFMDKFERKANEEIRYEILRLTDSDSIRDNTVPIVINILNKYATFMISDLLSKENYNNPLNRLLNEIQDLLSSFESEVRGKLIVTAGLKIKVYETINSNLESLMNESLKPLLSSIANEISKLGFWGTIASWFSSDPIEERKRKLLDYIYPKIHKIFWENLAKAINKSTIDTVKEISIKILDRIDEEIQKILDIINQIERTSTSEEDEVKKLRKQLKDLKLELENYIQIAKEISSSIGVEIGEV